MAILDRPLYGTEAKGKIKSTVTFFPRSANPLCTDEGEGVWYHIKAIGYRKESSAESRQASKDKFKEAMVAWYNLTPSQRAAYWPYAEGLQTNFNVFLREFIGGEQIMPQPFDGPVLVALLKDSLNLNAPGVSKTPDISLNPETAAQAGLTSASQTMIFSYNIP